MTKNPHINMMQKEINKSCKNCGEIKSLSEFYPHKTTKDRVDIYCKLCNKAISKARYRKYGQVDLEKLRERYRIDSKFREKKKRYWGEYRKEHPEVIVMAVKKWLLNNPLANKARNLTSYWIHQKGIKADKCSSCGSRGKIEAHHEDYSKPLDVMWLCRTCHLKTHGRLVVYNG